MGSGKGRRAMVGDGTSCAVAVADPHSVVVDDLDARVRLHYGAHHCQHTLWSRLANVTPCTWSCASEVFVAAQRQHSVTSTSPRGLCTAEERGRRRPGAFASGAERAHLPLQMYDFWEEVETDLQRAARRAMDPTSSLPRGCGEQTTAVRVVQALTGEELLSARCRCRHDLVAALAARLDDVWPGEIRLLLQGGNLWTDPQLPAELVQAAVDNEACTVQFLRVRATRSIVSPRTLRLAVLTRLTEMSPNLYSDDWCRDLGEPTAMIFVPMRESMHHIGYKGVARALLLRRRMDELLPMYDYNAAAVVETVLRDDALWLHLRDNVGRDNAKALLKALDRKGVIDLGDQRWRFQHR